MAGTPYALVYFSTAGEFILLGFDANPYMIPLGGVMPYIGATAPHTSYALAYGQAISRTTYATLFSLVSTTFGVGDGSTTFNIPDLRGRVPAGKDDMGGSAAGRLDSATTLGATQGTKTHTLASSEVPATGVTVNITDPGHTHTNSTNAGYSGFGVSGGSGNGIAYAGATVTINAATTGITASGAVQGGGGAHANVQPTIILNYILRII